MRRPRAATIGVAFGSHDCNRVLQDDLTVHIECFTQSGPELPGSLAP